MDIASKCSKNILLRKEQQLINIFDQLKNEPLTCDETEVRFLNRLARNSMESIKTLYLEEV